LFYNWWVEDFGWKRGDIQLGNTLSKIIVGPLFGFLAGWAIERFGVRRVSILGRLTMGYLADRCSKKRVMIATCLVVAGSIPLLVMAQGQPALIYLFALVFGFGRGADYMLIPLMTAECFGLSALGRILGLIITTDSIGEAMMPYLGALLRDATGSYATDFYLLTGIALLGAVAIGSIRYRQGIPVSRHQVGLSADAR
jgi:sugar phosphate permease